MSPIITRIAALGLLAGAAVITHGDAQAQGTSSAARGDAIGLAVAKGHQAAEKIDEGKNADYIPALAEVDPTLLGVVLVTVDGKIYPIGDVTTQFSIQSVAKPFTLAHVMDTRGLEFVEKKIGVNATGQPFNSVTAIEMNEEHRAGNPLVNAGAITTVSMVPAKSGSERWQAVLDNMSAFAGRKLSVLDDVYTSEAETNTHNRAIAWLLKDYKTIEGDPIEALDIYTRECSIGVTAKDLAVMGATLANGGVNPLTGKQVVSADVAARVLAVMSTGGLYETSGEWAYKVGVPAKSGVGGGIVAVVPGKFAIATFAPPLDDAGNSVRGQLAIETIVDELGAGLFASQPRQRKAPTAAR